MLSEDTEVSSGILVQVDNHKGSEVGLLGKEIDNSTETSLKDDCEENNTKSDNGNSDSDSEHTKEELEEVAVIGGDDDENVSPRALGNELEEQENPDEFLQKALPQSDSENIDESEVNREEQDDEDKEVIECEIDDLQNDPQVRAAMEELAELKQQTSDEFPEEIPRSSSENDLQAIDYSTNTEANEKKEQEHSQPQEMILPSPVHDSFTQDQIEDLVRQLESTTDPIEQETLGKQLTKASLTGIGKEVLPNRTGAFVNLLRSSHTPVQRVGLQIINNIGATGIAKRNFKQSGGFSIIVKLFSAEFEIQSLALNAIGYLITREVENARELMQVGGIPPLIAFLEHESSRIKFFAAACAWVLAAYQDEFQDALLNAGAIPKLLELINCAHEDISWQAAGALRNIVLKNDRVYRAIIEADGLHKYKIALRLDSDRSERVLGLIIQTFVIISSEKTIKEALYNVDLFSVLLERLNTNSTVEFRSRILYSLTNLCTKDKTNQDQFRNVGGVKSLLSLLSTEQMDETLRSDASTTLWACSINNEDTIAFLCEDETFRVLQQSLVLETEKVLVGIVATISNIAAFSSQYRNMLRERSIIPLILDFLRGSYIPLLETTGGAVMSLIRDNNENIQQLMEWDGPLLLARNITSENDGVKQNVLGALRLLLEKRFNKTMRAIRDVGALRSILILLKERSLPQLQINAACCLASIAEKNARAREDLISYHAEHGIRVGLTGSSTKLKSVVCDLIQYLAHSSESFRSVLGKNEIVLMVIDVIKDKKVDPILLEKAIRALWALCISNAIHQQLAKESGGISVLLGLLKAEDTRVHTKAAILKSLASICSKNYKNQEEVRNYNGAVANIVEALAVGEGVTELGEQAALAVWCLTLGNTRMKNTFRTLNGLIPLIDLLDKNQENMGVLVNTMGAIIALSRKSNSNRQIFKDGGIVNTISPLLKHENKYIAEQANDLYSLLGG